MADNQIEIGKKQEKPAYGIEGSVRERPWSGRVWESEGDDERPGANRPAEGVEGGGKQGASNQFSKTPSSKHPPWRVEELGGFEKKEAEWEAEGWMREEGG